VPDLTDVMCNRASRPYVSHATGIEFVIEYIEKYAANTVMSKQILAALLADTAGSTPKTQRLWRGQRDGESLDEHNQQFLRGAGAIALFGSPIRSWFTINFLRPTATFAMTLD